LTRGSRISIVAVEAAMKYHFSVSDMSCGHCKAHIEEALKASASIVRYEVDLALKKVEVETSLTSDEVIRLIDGAGYTAELRS
jgi:copper chaperone